MPRGMDEHRAAASGDTRPRIVINLDDEVIKIVHACQPISACACGYFDRPIVLAVSGIFAPTVRRGYALYRQRCRRAWVLVRAPPQTPEPEAAARRGAIALALVGLDSAVSKRHWKSQQPCPEPAPACIARLAPYCNPGQGSFLHPATPALFRCVLNISSYLLF